ncbi:hypothetical protein OZ411_42355 [Bradyrhizobium sp. Arg237L]|uniref:hypothetical protein n=1 Tax=Bradyrhizobium sp. Arg237L TaxID=3003352 RepID=UPI00249E7209|nr:hypothetical protein [Bradyrhizobium sp. Arg237L]MDI4239432.1 hypothetical protein [Bradyrhizobium sp. Arg237L]
MKNIQVIDRASNSTFSIFQATDEEFSRLFPDAGQEIQFAEDLDNLPAQDEVSAALNRIWERPIRKRDAQGIHGALFYGLDHYKGLYREKREDGVDPASVNAAQRRLFGI